MCILNHTWLCEVSYTACYDNKNNNNNNTKLRFAELRMPWADQSDGRNSVDLENNLQVSGHSDEKLCET